MKYLRQLAKIELIALAALAIFALAFACLSAAQASFATNPLFGVFGTGEVVFVYTIVTGSLPVVFLGAPLYFALCHFHKASWLFVLIIGIAPGCVALFIATFPALWALPCGAFVASVTHVICGRGSNPSSKRTRVPRAA
ncbi:hypothetical protein [Rhodanobacter denitrificans]|uniref:hypothetical protein n=1 Tax=Rhodanobacter denitrificans TaxID=666685 RepID=UPI0012FDE196|nr:hypothetical protein [Rhodanobacter denitrificans]UJM85660.1 hypothetical protein LRJ86_12835 [Rhodanobacter denitrificans]